MQTACLIGTLYLSCQTVYLFSSLSWNCTIRCLFLIQFMNIIKKQMAIHTFYIELNNIESLILRVGIYWPVLISYSIGETWKNCLEGATDFKEVKCESTVGCASYTLKAVFTKYLKSLTVRPYQSCCVHQHEPSIADQTWHSCENGPCAQFTSWRWIWTRCLAT